ncbi:MAG: 16S rRNA (uracil(1498)-N(3))-methyltransferase [Proteobacteria bacterium]|nr:16S rRNA (uracil(1498)-N(3))-methyltransferase [Pseudomonadota bacterium]
MTDDKVIKLPRLYVDSDLNAGAEITMAGDQAHYLRNVLRLRTGDGARLFNGRDGEWRGTVVAEDKKRISMRIETRLREQPSSPPETHLYFAPIKKARMDWLIEKAVELGATHLHPVLTQNTEVRGLNEDRIRAQIVEAAEQCERMDVPVLFSLKPMFSCLPGMPLLACLERAGGARLKESVPTAGPVAFLVGPEGGFTAEEKEKLQSSPHVTAISLGDRILRSETAAVMVLCAVAYS